MRPIGESYAAVKNGVRVTYFVQEVNEINVTWIVTEVFANHLKDRPLQNK